MNSQSNPGYSPHNHPLRDSGTFGSHNGPAGIQNRESLEIAEESPGHKGQPLINDPRAMQRNQTDTNPLKERGQAIQYEEEEEGQKLNNQNHQDDSPYSPFSPLRGSEKRQGTETLTTETRRLLYTESGGMRKNFQKKQSVGSMTKKSDEQKKKELRESEIELGDLLPQGAESVQELRSLYEEKRNMKMRSHLDVIPKAHQDEIKCVMFSPDYKYIISGSKDHSIKIFDAETRQEVYHIKEAHQRTVRALAMTSNMKYLVSGSKDKSVKVFEFETMQMIYDFQDERIFAPCLDKKTNYECVDPVTALTISSDNREIIVGYQNGSLNILNLNLRQQAHHYQNINNQKEITSVKVTPDSKFLVVLTSDGLFSVLNLLNKQQLYTSESSRFFPPLLALKSLKANIKSIVITPDSNFIIGGCSLGSIKTFQISNGQQIDSFAYEPQGDMPSENQVNQLVSSPDGQYLFVEYIDGHIVVWNMEAKEKIQVLQGINGSFNQIAVSEDADYLVACSKKKSICFIEIEAKEKNIFSLQKPGQEKISIKKVALAISPDSKYILFAIESHTIKIIDSQTKQQVFQNVFTFHEIISSINVTPDNKFIVVGLLDGSIKVCDFQKQELYPVFINIKTEPAARIAVTPDSRYIIATAEENSLIMLDLIENKQVHKFHKIHNDKITCVTVTPDNRFIVTTGYDKSVKLIDVTFKKEVYCFEEAQMGLIYSVAAAPNSKFILSSSSDLSIKMYDLSTKQPVHEFLFAHDKTVFTISISSDSRYVASGSGDASIKVYDIETKQLVYSLLHLHNEHITKVLFAPNDKYIVSLALDGSIKFIDFETNMEEDVIVPCSENTIKAMATTPDDKLVLIASEERIHGYDIKTKEKVFSVTSNHHEKIEAMVITPDGRFSVYGTERGSIGVFDIEKKEIIRFSKGVHKVNVLAITVTPDNQYIVSGSKDKSIKVIDLKTGKIEKHFNDIHEDRVRTLSVTPDSRYIISGSADKSIKILDLHAKDNEKVEVYHFNDATPRWIKYVTVSQNGKYIAACSDDRSIKIFDFKTKQLVHWFKNAHDDFIYLIAISKDNRYLVSGSSDRSVRIFDIQTRQLVHKFKNIHARSITGIAITSDNASFITSSNDGSVKILKLTPVKQIPSSTNQGIITNNGLDISQNEIYYVYNGFSKYSNFNSVDDFLWNQHIPIELAASISRRSPNLTVYPYQWNILHLAAVKGHDAFIQIMPEYSQFKVPFLLDAFNKTSLHYLIAQEKINLTSVNIMLNYICDYLEGLTRYQRYQAPEIIISLTPLFWFILTKTDIKIRVRFFNICSIPPPTPYNTELPAFGQPIADVAYFHPTIESIYESIDDIWENGEDQIEFRSSIAKLDYDVLSSDMQKTIKYLAQQKNEDIFKTTYVIDLINHLWNQTKRFLQIQFLIFSAYIIALSVYLTQEDRDLPFEIVILCCSGIFLFAEGLQIANARKDYIKDPWNWIDIVFHPLTIAFVITKMLGNEDELAHSWISTIIILFGYLRWISYLRIFKPTRNLIQVIVTVVNDMKSFIVIIALIIVGFSFIFLVFNRGRLFGFYLYNSYGSLYGPVDDGESSDSEKFFIALIAFLLNVILLNLLISIMGDSYAKVLEKRIKTAALTRLDMISEAATFLRFLKRKKELKRGFLVICESLEPTDNDDDDDGGDDWEEKVTVLKNLFKKSDGLAEKEMKRLQQKLTRIEDKTKANEEMLQQKMNAFEIGLQNQNEKTNKILFFLVEMEREKQKPYDDEEPARVGQFDLN